MPVVRRSAKQLYCDLVTLGYEGSYDRVAAFARNWRQRQREADQRASKGTYVPLVFAPGEAFQFDWSEDWAYVGGRKMKLQVAHFKLCHSRAFMLRAYPLQTHEMLFDAISLSSFGPWHPKLSYDESSKRGFAIWASQTLTYLGEVSLQEFTVAGNTIMPLPDPEIIVVFSEDTMQNALEWHIPDFAISNDLQELAFN